MRQSLLQNVPRSLLKNTTSLLQNTIVITNYEDFITKCDRYYKMQRLLQFTMVQFARV